MDKSVHFVDYCLIDNTDKIYDIKFINRNTLCTCDIGGNINYYTITNVNDIASDKDNDSPISYTKLNSIKAKDTSIYTIDSIADMLLLGTDTGEVSILQQNNKPVYTTTTSQFKPITKCKFLSETLFSVGDETGSVLLYDTRTKSKPLATFTEQKEEITDIAYTPSKDNYLLSSSIEGTLCVYDIRKLKLYALSDCIEEDINCLCIVRDDEKVACGTAEGTIALFNWDWFGDYKDRIPGHPQGILCMQRYNDNVVLTGSEDGGIRVNVIQPKCVCAIIAGKKECEVRNKEFNEVSAIGMNEEEGGLLGAVCNINYVKVFDVSGIDFRGMERRDNGDEDEVLKDYEEKEDVEEERDRDRNRDDDNEKDIESFDEENDEEEDNNNDDESNKDEENDDEGSNNIDNDNNYDNDSNLSISENEKGTKLTIKAKKKSIIEAESKSKDKKTSEEEVNDEDDSDSDSDSSVKKTKKSKKMPSLGKKRYSEAIILKEKRKEFFNDL